MIRRTCADYLVIAAGIAMIAILLLLIAVFSDLRF